MVIKIFPKFTKDAIGKVVLQKLMIVKRAYISYLILIGEEFVRNARMNANFTDRTGNLRNSIGYIILEDGKVIEANFTDTSEGDGKTTGKLNGKAKGLAKAMEVAEKFPKGLVLICVAGMEYAAAVESKGFDVITSSTIVAKESLKQAVSSVYKNMQTL